MPSTTGAMPLTQVSLTVVFLEAVLFRAISSERESTSNMIQLTFKPRNHHEGRQNSFLADVQKKKIKISCHPFAYELVGEYESKGMI